MLKLIIEVGPYFALLTKQHRVALLSRKYWPMWQSLVIRITGTYESDPCSAYLAGKPACCLTSCGRSRRQGNVVEDKYWTVVICPILSVLSLQAMSRRALGLSVRL